MFKIVIYLVWISPIEFIFIGIQSTSFERDNIPIFIWICGMKAGIALADKYQAIRF